MQALNKRHYNVIIPNFLQSGLQTSLTSSIMTLNTILKQVFRYNTLFKTRQYYKHTELLDRYIYAFCFVEETLIITGGSDELYKEYQENDNPALQINYFDIPNMKYQQQKRRLVESDLIHRTGPKMNFMHTHHSCCSDGKRFVYIIGQLSSKTPQKVEQLDFKSGSVRILPDLQGASKVPANSILMQNNHGLETLWVFQNFVEHNYRTGVKQTSKFFSLQLLKIQNDVWDDHFEVIALKRPEFLKDLGTDFGVTQIDQNRILIFGGLDRNFDEKKTTMFLDFDSTNNPQEMLEIYNESRFSMKSGPPMPVGVRTKQAGHAVGQGLFTYVFEEYNDLLRFDKINGKWTQIDVNKI